MRSLDFLTVVDLSESVAGQFCGRLFADHGADVVLAEPTTGSATRDRPGLFAHLNTGKRSVLVPPGGTTGLVRDADVVILPADVPRDVLDAAGDRTVSCAITEFGRAGPRAAWLGNELVHQSLSGLAYLTGTDERCPLFGFGHRAYYSAGAAGFAATVAAVIERGRSGLGQLVEVSVAETAAAMSPNLVAQFDYNGTYPLRGAYPGWVDTYRCRDGWVVLFILSGRWPAVCAAFGLARLADDERFSTAAALTRNWPTASRVIAVALSEMDVASVVELGQRNRFPVEAVLDVATIMSDRPRWLRGYLATGAPPGERAPGPLSGTPPSVSGTAAAPVARPAAVPASAPRDRPLAGYRVLELTTAWAGPMVGRSLAFLGAQVIKVESLRNIDAWRGTPAGGDPQRYPDLTAGTRPHNRNCWFNSQNHDKLSIELDLKNPAGQDVMRRLIAVSDVLVCNLAPGALTRLGLDHATLNAIRPDLVVLEISGFGHDSPMADHVAVGPTVEATTGIMTLIGYGDGTPYNSGFAYLDPWAGLLGTGIVLSALAARAVTGRGGHVALSLREAGVQLLGEYLAEFADTGVNPSARANGATHACPHGIFPAAGSDEWLAVAVTDDRQWHALCAAMGRPDLATDPELAHLEGRLRHRPAVEYAVASWAVTRDKHEAAADLQACRVPAAPVNTGADLATDPHLAAIGFYQGLTHPEAGRHRYQGLPYRLTATPGRIADAAPCLGADTDHVLRHVLGMSAQDIEALTACGAATDNRPAHTS